MTPVRFGDGERRSTGIVRFDDHDHISQCGDNAISSREMRRGRRCAKWVLRQQQAAFADVQRHNPALRFGVHDIEAAAHHANGLGRRLTRLQVQGVDAERQA